MSRDVTLKGVEFSNPEILAIAAEVLGLELKQNVDVRYFGGKTIKHQYGIELKDCPYDLGFDVKMIKDSNGKSVGVLEIKGDSELLEVDTEDSYFYKKSKNGLDKIGLECNLLQQAYDIAQCVQVCQYNNFEYNVEVMPDRTLVMRASY